MLSGAKQNKSDVQVYNSQIIYYIYMAFDICTA